MGQPNNATWTRHAGNVSDTIQVEVSKALGDTLAVVASVSATVRNRVTGAETALSAAVTDSTNRIVTVALGAWLQSTAQAGDEFYVSLDITVSGGATMTFPEKLSQRPLLAIV